MTAFICYKRALNKVDKVDKNEEVGHVLRQDTRHYLFAW